MHYSTRRDLTRHDTAQHAILLLSRALCDTPSLWSRTFLHFSGMHPELLRLLCLLFSGNIQGPLRPLHLLISGMLPKHASPTTSTCPRKASKVICNTLSLCSRPWFRTGNGCRCLEVCSKTRHCITRRDTVQHCTSLLSRTLYNTSSLWSRTFLHFYISPECIQSCFAYDVYCSPETSKVRFAHCIYLSPECFRYPLRLLHPPVPGRSPKEYGPQMKVPIKVQRCTSLLSQTLYNTSSLWSRSVIHFSGTHPGPLRLPCLLFTGNIQGLLRPCHICYPGIHLESALLTISK